ncbi:SanA/YdcF family protein [Saccharopolyspora mangrovi]|uniref:ElyC/SanA/YdcF family protein n=1 Tax=Saccharopolyspora mangrovi TaxID=3082379 RepID=A0ABU6ABA4_9PSEU|nr:ElyC/SanA/YdcF family protein [Saccharopolyspora sp. S2-29]MEB3368830.1 ElyC/SanA/YdcF family protein [Saccharopolyspora sp. S2-29]
MRLVWVVLGVVAGGFLLPLVWAWGRSFGRVRDVDDVPAKDVALVLGAGVRWDGIPSRILQGRLDVARELFRTGKVQRIIVSGSPESRGHSEPVVMRRYLVSHGVPESGVVLDESGVDTYSSCRRASEEHASLTIVTTRFHLRRSIALARRLGVDACGVGHDAAAEGLRRVNARATRREVLATVKAFWMPR